MVLGYVLIGAVTGLVVFVASLIFGASWWFASILYTLVGSTVMILVPTVQMLFGHLAAHPVESDGPLEAGPLQSFETATAQPGANREMPMRILAVDDDPFILELIPMISAKVGFTEVETALSGEEALAALGDIGKIFDCVLLDINMPKMDGIELCKRIRRMSAYSHTPIIMLTAMRDMKNMGNAFRAGATDYATKPFDIAELGTRLKLAQETVRARHQTVAAKRHATDHPASAASGGNSDLSRAVGNLIERTVLMNYLTHLPRREMDGIQVFAVGADLAEPTLTQLSAQQRASLPAEVAVVAAELFGPERTLMAFFEGGTLLVIADSAGPISSEEIEARIERHLAVRLFGPDTREYTGVEVSVGGPLQPYGTKSDRAWITSNRAIALMEIRALNRQGSVATGLFGG